MALLGVKWLWGYRKVGCEKCHSVRLLNIMMREDISYFGLTGEDSGDISFFLLEKDYKILMSILDKNALKVYSVYGRGLPFICKAHRNRIGIPVGLGIFFTLIFMSSLFVWDIKVVSSTDTPHNVIIANLETLGCYEGAFIPAIDFEDLCIDYVDKYTDFSWVSVNVRGTVAYVEIREKDLYSEDAHTPRNLIASYGGIIEDYSVYEGKSRVQPGNVVKRGDLLISGIVENKEGAARLCRARGEVMATVDTTLEVTVPYNYKKQVYTGRSYESQQIKFFNMTFPFLSDNQPEDITCTHMSEINSAVLFERIELPLSIEKEVFREYTVRDLVYTSEEARNLAKRLMKEKFDTELTGAELITVKTSEEENDKGYTLTCEVKCRLDITKPAEIQT